RTPLTKTSIAPSASFGSETREPSTPIECPRRAPPGTGSARHVLARPCAGGGRLCRQRRIRAATGRLAERVADQRRLLVHLRFRGVRLRRRRGDARLVRDPLPPPWPPARGRGAAGARGNEARADVDGRAGA